ncbi:MAG: lactate utilization protein [Gammaproteobacteria bacterium]|nr:lactate utilization protein [Gammaproteobacteria bacterium]
MSDSRQRILDRLRANRPTDVPTPMVYAKALGWDRERCIAAFSERMQAVRGEVHRMQRDAWVGWLSQQLPERGLHRVLVGNGRIGDALAAVAAQPLQVRRYDRPIESWKPELFGDIDVAVTGARAGLAESGSLVLWPDAEEPRLMSLVPPVHVALLDADRLYENFAALIVAEHWGDGMPTNALLISGPSKTADIEQTLAYGIHGPKELVTLLLE